MKFMKKLINYIKNKFFKKKKKKKNPTIYPMF